MTLQNLKTTLCRVHKDIYLQNLKTNNKQNNKLFFKLFVNFKYQSLKIYSDNFIASVKLKIPSFGHDPKANVIRVRKNKCQHCDETAVAFICILNKNLLLLQKYIYLTPPLIFTVVT